MLRKPTSQAPLPPRSTSSTITFPAPPPDPKPANEATYKGLNPTFTWHPGLGSASSDVYFGTDQTAVATATTASPEYLGRLTEPHHASDTLEILTVYFWRVDSVSAGGTVTPGRVWSFTVGEPQIILSQQQAARSYGGRASFQADLLIDYESVTSADLTLYLGTADGGTDPEAWQQVIDIGAHPDGPISVTLDALPAGTYFYRFLATTTYRSAWAPATASLGSNGDLSQWPKTALIAFPGYTGAETLADFPVLVRLSPSDPARIHLRSIVISTLRRPSFLDAGRQGSAA